MVGSRPALTSLPLATLVDASTAVGATRSRKEKTAALAELLQAASHDEVALVVSLIAGEPRQGRIGVGWSTLAGIDTLPAAEATLSVADIDTLLDRVSATTGEGSAAARQELLGATLSRATATEADFVRRLLLGELRQGANEGLVVEGVAKATGVKAAVVRRALMLSGDLGLVTETAVGAGAEGLAAIGLELGRPMRPMLASTAPGVADAVTDLGRASVEWKLDGARIQVHRRDDVVAIWTRNLNEITGRLPGVVRAVQALPAESLVLDGEVLGFAEDEAPLAFQDTMSDLGADEADTSGLRPFFFDVLHRDGLDLVDESLSVRREHLEEVCGPLAIPGVLTEDAAVGEDVLAAALEAGHEGVMVKSADSTYEAGRRGKTWRKVKPVHTLDLVVLAAEWGHGRRTGWLSNLHLGARDPAGGWVMVGKTFKGLTDELLQWQTDAFLDRETHRSGITVHVRPELVVEIALDGVQASTKYPGGVALRFARVKGYRPDKAPEEADVIDTVRSMR